MATLMLGLRPGVVVMETAPAAGAAVTSAATTATTSTAGSRSEGMRGPA